MKLLVLFFSLLLYGCASGMKVSVPDSYTEVSTARGYLVGVIGASAIWPQTGENLKTTIELRKLLPNGSKGEPILLTNDNKQHDFATPAQTGQLFTLLLPEGEYDISKVTIEGSDGNRSFISTNKDDLNIHFTVRSDQISYIGEFIAVSHVAESQLWNMEYPSGKGYLVHNYAENRDQPLFYELNPNLKEIAFHTEKLGQMNFNFLQSVMK
ncbi:hypothetical protein I3260_14560 [Photobacterium damselae]|uniref:hypothetical protein n=1 Tax=Photobacterium damselae TaxID=38293 RepID=UPI001EDCCCD6|nr:hypothetical protein [Photobacterium damselae]MCG3813467.1 hypothetical protein [Photobacterium damselae]